jgi:hypothetical protein
VASSGGVGIGAHNGSCWYESDIAPPARVAAAAGTAPVRHRRHVSQDTETSVGPVKDRQGVGDHATIGCGW